jgi:demethylmenaquinone methyltransferase/2-methoxy-6-polyprenyl-1,4-benzoquinol methylase
MPSEHPAKPKAGVQRERQVQRLFSEIAPRYDLLNHVLSLNVDKVWRRKAVDLLGWERAADGRFLDACSGTFDLALELSGRPGFRGRVVASDFAQPMLREGTPKLAASPVVPVCGDSLQLPFPDDTFEGAMVGFGVRNLADLKGGIRELRRVLRPGARLVVLEFTTPPNTLVRWSYLFYFHRILPLVGRLVSGHPWAYSYLPKSVREFPGPSALEAVFRDAGFRETDHRLLSLGIAALHWGVK